MRERVDVYVDCLQVLCSDSGQHYLRGSLASLGNFGASHVYITSYRSANLSSQTGRFLMYVQLKKVIKSSCVVDFQTSHCRTNVTKVHAENVINC